MVIDGYVNGVRKRHINAFGYFTIALTFSSFFFFVFLKWFPNLLDYSVQSVNYSDAYSKEQLELQSNFTKTMFEYSSLVFFLTIPLMSLVSRIVFWKNKKYNYAEHLIINLLYLFASISCKHFFIFFNYLEPKFIYNSFFFCFICSNNFLLLCIKKTLRIRFRRNIT